MNFKQLQYAIEVSKLRNFSLASEKLNISQPALSKQILHLEQELGIKLFDRNTVPLTLTPAGEHFLTQASLLVRQEELLLHSLDGFKTGEKGRLVIGMSPFRNLSLMPDIIQQFLKKFPGVQVVLHESNSDQLRKDAAEGKYDLAIVNLPVDDGILDVIPLEKESIVLAVPNEMVRKLPENGSKDLRSVCFADCKDLPFVVVAQGQEMRRYFDNLCATSGVSPKIAVEIAGGVTSAWSMARSGIGATLLPLQFVGHQQFDSNLTLLTLSDTPYSRQPVIVTRRGQCPSPFASYMIELLTQF